MIYSPSGPKRVHQLFTTGERATAWRLCTLRSKPTPWDSAHSFIQSHKIVIEGENRKAIERRVVNLQRVFIIFGFPKLCIKFVESRLP